MSSIENWRSGNPIIHQLKLHATLFIVTKEHVQNPLTRLFIDKTTVFSFLYPFQRTGRTSERPHSAT